MLARIRRSMDNKDQGFTLIELLVVIIIIGILAAIAIPVFLNQRKKAVDSGLKADLKNAATVVETAYTNTQAYPAGTLTWAAANNPNAVGSENVIVSPNNTLTYYDSATYGVPGAYCISATNPAGSQTWIYMSDLGGLQPSTVTSC